MCEVVRLYSMCMQRAAHEGRFILLIEHPHQEKKAAGTADTLWRVVVEQLRLIQPTIQALQSLLE